MCVILGMNVGMDMTDAGVFVEVLMRRRVHGPRVVAHDVLHRADAGWQVASVDHAEWFSSCVVPRGTCHGVRATVHVVRATVHVHRYTLHVARGTVKYQISVDCQISLDCDARSISQGDPGFRDLGGPL
jgi:hypothetical protein